MRYWVQAVTADNHLLVREFEASDQDSLRALPELRGCTILQIKSRSLAWAMLWAFLRGNRPAKQVFPVLLFSREVLALLAAGLSLTEVLDTLVEKEHHVANRKLLEAVRLSLHQGRTLSDALAEFPQIFSDFYVAMIRASEKTGSMSEALQRYIRYQEQAEVVRKRVVSASIYPVVLMAVGFLVGLFLLFYVVPRFGSIYEDMRGDIPFFSQVLINWGKFFAAHASSILLGLGLVLGGVAYVLSLKKVRIWLMQQVWRIPTLGEQIHLYQLSRLYRTLGMLLRGGMPMVTAIDMAKGLLSADLQVRLGFAARDIREGLALSLSMEKYQLSTPVASRLMRVGERTGEMGEMLERTAEFMDEEMARWIEWFTKLFEPLLMAVIGVIIGLIVVLMYMPIFELAGNIQ